MAGGTFSTNSLPTSPGFYVNFESVANVVVNGGVSGVVLVPFTADWGPQGEFVSVASLAEYDAVYSSSNGGTGRYAVAAALQGLGSRPGARSVLCYRIVGSSGTAGVATVLGTGGTWVTLTAKYKGARSSNWTVTVQANPADATKTDLILFENGIEIERHSALTSATAASWVSQISSDYFVVTSGVATAPTNASNITFTSTVGNSGLTTVGSDWVAFQSAAENQTFNVIAPAELTDSSVRSALATWAISRNVSGQRFMLVLGGEAGETISTANTRSTSFNNENIVNLGYTDLYDLEGNTISTAKFAPRIAGVIADAGVSRSITQQRLSDVSLKVYPTRVDIAAAYSAGTLLIVADSVSPRVHQGMTTYTSNAATKPRSEFGKIKSVMTHHQIETDLTLTANDNWLGGDNINTPDYQAVLVSGISAYLRRLADNDIIRSDYEVRVDDSEDNTGDALYLVYGISTVKSIERIFNTIVLS